MLPDRGSGPDHIGAMVTHLTVHARDLTVHSARPDVPASPSRVACARLIRWAAVASGTKSPAPTSLVVRPPTARNINATCDLGVSAGCAPSTSRFRVSSASGSGRVGRHPLPRPLLGGRDQGQLHGVLAVAEGAVPPRHRCEEARRLATPHLLQGPSLHRRRPCPRPVPLRRPIHRHSSRGAARWSPPVRRTAERSPRHGPGSRRRPGRTPRSVPSPRHTGRR